MTLADRAFQVYDQQGEREMINFLIDHRDPGTPRDMPETMGSYPLADGSGIEVYSDIYTNERTQQYRDVKLAPGEIPLYAMETAPMLAWPNSDTIRTGVLTAAVLEAQGRLQKERTRRGENQDHAEDPRGPDQLIPLSQALSLAPSLDGAVINALDIQEREGLPEYAREFLEDRQRHCAEYALKCLREPEREALVQAAMEKLRQQAEG